MPFSSTTGSLHARTPNKTKRLLRNFAIGAVFGGLIGFVAARFDLLDRLPGLSGEDVASLCIAALLFGAGAFTLWAAGNPDRYRRVLETRDDDEPTDPVALRTGRQSGIVCMLAGAMLAIPPLAAQTLFDQPLRLAAFAAIVVMLAIETLVNWRIWRDGDELTRSVIVTTGAVSFWIGQGALFVWATLAKLSLVPEPSAWAILTAWMGLYLAASIAVSARRGFGEFA